MENIAKELLEEIEGLIRHVSVKEKRINKKLRRLLKWTFFFKEFYYDSVFDPDKQREIDKLFMNTHPSLLTIKRNYFYFGKELENDFFNIIDIYLPNTIWEITKHDLIFKENRHSKFYAIRLNLEQTFNELKKIIENKELKEKYSYFWDFKDYLESLNNYLEEDLIPKDSLKAYKKYMNII